MLAGTSPVLLLYQHQQPLISPDTMTDDADADDAASKRLKSMQCRQRRNRSGVAALHTLRWSQF